jgi:hypothetical protein
MLKGRLDGFSGYNEVRIAKKNLFSIISLFVPDFRFDPGLQSTFRKSGNVSQNGEFLNQSLAIPWKFGCLLFQRSKNSEGI